MEVLGGATRTRLKRYHDEVQKMAADYPGLWWIVACADLRMRQSHLERIRRRLAKEHAEFSAAGLRTDFDLQVPWDVVFREAARDRDFWGREVDKKVVQYVTSQRSQSQLLDPGCGIVKFSGVGAGKKRGGDGAGSDGEAANKSAQKRAKRKAESAITRTAEDREGREGRRAPNAQASRGGGKAKGKGGSNDAKDAHGRFFRTATGSQLCWDWNRSPGGCADPCPAGRAHRCEVCRGPHRSCAHPA